jgi:hypothetical protein
MEGCMHKIIVKRFKPNIKNSSEIFCSEHFILSTTFMCEKIAKTFFVTIFRGSIIRLWKQWKIVWDYCIKYIYFPLNKNSSKPKQNKVLNVKHNLFVCSVINFAPGKSEP